MCTSPLVPSVVGVPVSTPDALKLRPAGSEPMKANDSSSEAEKRTEKSRGVMGTPSTKVMSPMLGPINVGGKSSGWYPSG